MKRMLAYVMPAVLLFAGCESVPDQSEPFIATVQEEPAVVVISEEPETAVVEKTKAAEVLPVPVFRLERMRSFLSNGVLDTVTEYRYKDGLLTEEREQYADGTLAGSIKYSYEGDLVKKWIKEGGRGASLSTHAFAYDDSGNLTKDSLLDPQGKPIFTYIYEYDRTNRRSLLKIYASDDTLLSYAEYFYEDGKNVRVESFNTLDVLQEYLARTFDDRGFPLLELITEVSGQELEKVRYEYSGDMVSRKETFVRTRRTGAEEYRYDDFGNLSTRIRYDRTGKAIETNEYIYVEVESNEE